MISATGLTQGRPLVWLNDGTGHFSTLTVGDFVTAGNESLLGGGHLIATRNGYSFITTQFQTGGGAFTTRGLNVIGLLATKPYRRHLDPVRPPPLSMPGTAAPLRILVVLRRLPGRCRAVDALVVQHFDEELKRLVPTK
jgi:hypothetical protein